MKSLYALPMITSETDLHSFLKLMNNHKPIIISVHEARLVKSCENNKTMYHQKSYAFEIVSPKIANFDDDKIFFAKTASFKQNVTLQSWKTVDWVHERY